MTERNNGGRSTTASHPSSTSYPTDVNIIERVWEVREGATPKAGLVLIHGGMWHSGWFGELGDHLSSSRYDIRVSAPDLLSHGLSDDVFAGFRTYVPNFTHHAVVVRAAIARARDALPEGTPVFALGESMGGLCILQHLVIHEVDVDGVILCGAVLEIADALMPPRFMIPLLKFLGRLMPRVGVPGQDIGGDTFDRAFGDPAVGPAARADPLVTDKVVPRLGVMTGALNAMDMVKTEAPKKITVKSVLMMHYKDDERVMYEACKAVVDTIPTDDKVYVTLQGTYHQIFQDTPERSKEYGENVAHFIVERTK